MINEYLYLETNCSYGCIIPLLRTHLLLLYLILNNNANIFHRYYCGHYIGNDHNYNTSLLTLCNRFFVESFHTTNLGRRHTTQVSITKGRTTHKNKNIFGLRCFGPKKRITFCHVIES